MKMPTPPIVGVEQRLSVADGLESTQKANLPRATRLRQTILKKAFTFEDFDDVYGQSATDHE